MRIEAVELTLIELPLKAPFEASVGVLEKRQLVLVKVEGDGFYGWGEASPLNEPTYNYETAETAWHILETYLVPLVLGREVAHPSRVRELYAPVRGHNFAKAGLENAVWDWFARAQGVPLCRLLGGEKERIGVGVSIGIQPSPEELVRVVERFAGQGYQRMKIKIKPGKDLPDLSAVRRAFPDLPIMADANSAYTLEDIPTFQAMDELNLLMYEQPLAWDDIVDHARLQAAVTTPVCLDESVHSPEDARKALELGSCRMINIKVGRVSGHQAAKEIHDLMYQRGLPVWCGGMFESGVGRAHNIHLTTLPGFTLPGDTSASDRYYHEDIVDEPAVLNPDGTLTVPTRPGIGVDVLPDRLERYARRTRRFVSG
ncbi:MAG: o-succinylbenzoate synthase [Bacillota bacterium]